MNKIFFVMVVLTFGIKNTFVYSQTKITKPELYVSQCYFVDEKLVPLDDRDDILKETQEIFDKFYKTKTVINDIIISDDSLSNDFLKSLTKIYLQSLKNSIFFVNHFGPWYKSENECFKYLMPDKNVIDFDYILNFLDFVNAENGVYVILAPQERQLTFNVKEENFLNVTSGKFILIVKYPSDFSYHKAIKNYLIALDASINNKKIKTFSDFLSLFKNQIKEYNLIPSFYKVSSSKDIEISKLGE